MTLLLIISGFASDSVAQSFSSLEPERPVEVWPDQSCKPESIRYILAWNAPIGLIKQFSNLEVLFSFGAKIDHLMRDPDLPPCPIVRYVEADLTERMSEYVVLHVLMHHRRVLDYRDLQRQKDWREFPQPAANEVRVGIMGLGVLGQDAAAKLAGLGFQVAGWSRSEKHLNGVQSFAGAAELDPFLARTDILVCLLPHTSETEGFVNRSVIRKLARDGAGPRPVFINAGRGPVQDEAGILAALEAGELHAASLDVFETEPLPKTSQLWCHPRVIVTPHNAAVTSPGAVARYVLRQISRYEHGEPLENVVDVERGY